MKREPMHYRRERFGAPNKTLSEIKMFTLILSFIFPFFLLGDFLLLFFL